MKISKILFVVVMFGMLCVCQRGFTMTAHLVNLSQERGPEAKGTPEALRGEIEKGNKDEKLASNAVLDAAMIARIEKDGNAVVKVAGVDVKGVISPAAYVTGYAATGLASGTVNIDGNTYNLAESTVNPILFSAEFATTQTDRFQAAVGALQPDQVAVIVTTESNTEAIRASLEAKGVNFDRISIVQATTRNSQTAFAELFDQHGQGFSLRDANRDNPTVVTRALQGAV